MKKITATLHYLRIAPRKIRLLANLIRGKKAVEAKAILNFTLKKGAKSLNKLLSSAIASAKNDFQLKEESLYISKISVDQGPTLKRQRARSRGRSAEIQKKTSHINVVLENEKNEKSVKRKA